MSDPSAILMPKLGLTMTEGVLASWLVKPGEQVREGQTIFVVETEKISTEVPANAAGVIVELLVGEGETVPVGATVARWTSAGAGLPPTTGRGAVPAATDTAQIPHSQSGAHAPSPAAGERVLATPLARRIARTHGVDLRTLTGTGPRGRIKAADVEATIVASAAKGPESLAQGDAGAAQSGRVGPGRSRPLSGFQKTMARRLTEAKQTIPHFYVLATADITDLLELRRRLNEDSAAPKVSVTHFILIAVGRALRDDPGFAAVWVDDGVLELGTTDVGLAVDTPRGLLAPVVRDVGSRSLNGLATEAESVIERARSGALLPDDFHGGAITVSNVGMHGAAFLVPIINPGQSAILGVGAASRVFRPDKQGAPRLREELGLVLSCDHRVTNGVSAARFLNRIVAALQNPLGLLRGSS
ncbi:2-oxo acid dehydrogenase subunit E2 [Alsobacter sp. SYSU M60028]|uniref:Dihydrolipoamide acetyltransferase component of pyruvate dehydrogenase complex n=1 Tax=Alsobacter ponti TaxID=2962936 RepID=A0ABT1L8E0_9HYPH|nr:dihydrolipoamide acetyltransferase family protein [Alsobacter ponti]MCP8937767.1 2-oxo acid dehydrogenase subunit E2 [Alsobacter ponti]